MRGILDAAVPRPYMVKRLGCHLRLDERYSGCKHWKRMDMACMVWKVNADMAHGCVSWPLNPPKETLSIQGATNVLSYIAAMLLSQYTAGSPAQKRLLTAVALWSKAKLEAMMHRKHFERYLAPSMIDRNLLTCLILQLNQIILY